MKHTLCSFFGEWCMLMRLPKDVHIYLDIPTPSQLRAKNSWLVNSLWFDYTRRKKTKKWGSYTIRLVACLTLADCCQYIFGFRRLVGWYVGGPPDGWANIYYDDDEPGSQLWIYGHGLFPISIPLHYLRHANSLCCRVDTVLWHR